jgi:hypothetical protein
MFLGEHIFQDMFASKEGEHIFQDMFSGLCSYHVKRGLVLMSVGQGRKF